MTNYHHVPLFTQQKSPINVCNGAAVLHAKVLLLWCLFLRLLVYALEFLSACFLHSSLQRRAAYPLEAEAYKVSCLPAGPRHAFPTNCLIALHTVATPWASFWDSDITKMQ